MKNEFYFFIDLYTFLFENKNDAIEYKTTENDMVFYDLEEAEFWSRLTDYKISIIDEFILFLVLEKEVVTSSYEIWKVIGLEKVGWIVVDEEVKPYLKLLTEKNKEKFVNDKEYAEYEKTAEYAEAYKEYVEKNEKNFLS